MSRIAVATVRPVRVRRRPGQVRRRIPVLAFACPRTRFSEMSGAPAVERPLNLFGGPRRPLLPFVAVVRDNEEVVPVNVSAWVLPCGVTAGR